MARGARLSPPVPVPVPVLLLALLAVRGARACCVVYDSCLTGGWDVVVGRDLGIAPGGPDPRGVICLSGTFGNNGVLQRAPAGAAVFGSVNLGSAVGAQVAVTLAADDGSYNHTVFAAVLPDYTFKAVLAPRPAGGSYSLTAACATCPGTGPSAVTKTANTFGDIFVLAGQSNLVLSPNTTFERNASIAAILRGEYDNIRYNLAGLRESQYSPGNWLSPPIDGDCASSGFIWGTWCRSADLVHAKGWSWGDSVSAVGYYFAQEITDRLIAAGSGAVPIGLIHVPIGGTMIEEWASFDTAAQCINATCLCATPGCNATQPLNAANCTNATGAMGANGVLYHSQVEGLINMTIAGWLWLQGENSAGMDAGNVLDGTGYACILRQMVADWRAIWSVTPGTTSPTAPFFVFDLADGTDEGNADNLGSLRWALTSNYGTLPSPSMPNTYHASAYDFGDTWDGYICYVNSCCVPTSYALGAECDGDHRGLWDNISTPFYMNQLHPRPKQGLAKRGAQAALATLYGLGGPAAGPVISGCVLSGASLTISFNETLLAGESVAVSKPAGAAPMSLALDNTALWVLVNATLPADAGANHRKQQHSYLGPFSTGNELGVSGWVAAIPKANGDNSVPSTLRT